MQGNHDVHQNLDDVGRCLYHFQQKKRSNDDCFQEMEMTGRSGSMGMEIGKSD